MLRYPHVYDQQQLEQQPAYEVDYPAEYHDFGDRGHLLSCDSIESVESVETREERHLRWLREWSYRCGEYIYEFSTQGPQCLLQRWRTLYGDGRMGFLATRCHHRPP